MKVAHTLTVDASNVSHRTRFGIEPPATWLGLVATLVALALGTLLVYPLK